MGKVYTQAEEVIAWIGREEDHPNGCTEDDTLVALEALENVHPVYQMHMKGYHQWFSDISDISNASDRRLHGLKKLFSRSYWGRMWIIQEVILAKRLHIKCGRYNISWGKMACLCNKIKTQNTRMDNDAFDLMETFAYSVCERRLRFTTRQANKKHLTLSEGIRSFSKFECHDARDNFFGLLSICRLCCNKAVSVDYSMDLRSICVNLIRHDITHHGREPILVADDLWAVFQRKKTELHTTNKGPFINTSTPLKSLGTDSVLPGLAQDFGNIITLSSLDDVDGPEESKLTTSSTSDLISSEAENMARFECTTTPLVDRKIIACVFREPHTKKQIPYFDLNSNAQKIPQAITFQASSLPPVASHPYIGSGSKTNTVLSATRKPKKPKMSSIFGFTSLLKGVKGKHNEETTLRRESQVEPYVPEDILVDFLRIITKEGALQFQKHGIVLFITTTGMIGSANNGVSLGDKVLRLGTGKHGDERRLLICNDVGSCTGRGLVLHPRHYPYPYVWGVPQMDLFIGKRSVCNWLEAEIDIDALFYVAGPPSSD